MPPGATECEILEKRLHSALFLACDAGLLQIELSLDASARLVGNFALAEQLVDVFALGGNQSDQVRKQYEPRARIVGHFWPVSQPPPKIGSVTVADDGAGEGSET